MSCQVQPSLSSSPVMLSSVRRICARKSPMCTLSPFSSIEAVPEISRMVSPFRSMRMPRENELGLA